MDTLILASSLQSFVLFVLAYALMLVVLKDRHALTGARVLYVLALAYNVYVMEAYPAFLILLSSFMLSLYIYAYYLCVSHILFGTSLYVKLITLLDTKTAVTIDDIQARYGAKGILDSHLKQMLDSKEITVSAQGRYALKPCKNIFLISSLRKVLKDLVNISSN